MSAETALREALEAEWYNGNMTEGAYDRILAALAARRVEPAPTLRDPATCAHIVITTFGDGENGPSLWACEDCRLRFYPACRTCVDVGHRNIEHPAALAARPDVGSGPFDHEPPDLGTHCAGCAARPVSPPLDVAARAYREAHDLLAVTHTSAQRTVVIERLNDLAKAALAARVHNIAQRVRADDSHDQRWLDRIAAIEAEAYEQGRKAGLREQDYLDSAAEVLADVRKARS